MAISDPIGDGLTKIRNASRVRHPSVDVRFSRVFGHILDVLRQEGFIRAYKVLGDRPSQRTLRVYLKYAPSTAPDGVRKQSTPAITQIIRASKPGVRMYRKARGLPRVLGGLGAAVVSTSNGIMTERDAYQRHIGGEVLCYVW